jgi:PPOX class probable F420-dependent enzyme
MAVIDTSTEQGQAIVKRFGDELIMWLTTLGRDGAPHPKPVWFLWDNDEILIHSQPNAAANRNIARDGRVALHLNSSQDGGNVVVINGAARLIEKPQTVIDNAAYVAKYVGQIKDIQMTPESFSAAYSVEIRVTPEKLWAF